jgi:alanine racemase
MDMIAVDVTDLPAVAVGDRAELWGPNLPVEELAAAAGTIPYELLCGVSQRVPLELE